MKYINFEGKSYPILDSTLSLRNRNISDITKIKDLNTITKLKRLDLSYNNIYEIDGLESLVNLEVLNLSKNNINKIKGLENLTKLKKLYLFENQLTKIDGLTSLEQLEIISFSQNKISEINGLENLKNLKKISFYNNNLIKIKGLESQNKLYELNFIRNKITKIEGLASLKNLRILYLDQNEINEIENIEILTELNVLGLFHNQIKEIKGLKKNIKLKKINLNQNLIKEIKGLNKLTNLNILELSSNQISEITGLDNLKGLRYLNLYGNNITKIKGLENNIHLEYLSLEENNITEGKELIKLLDHKNIKYLGFDYNKIKFIDKRDQNRLLLFLNENYKKLYITYSEKKKKFQRLLNSPSNKFPKFKSKIKDLLERLIGILNLLINLYQTEWHQEMLFHNDLISLMDDRINLEEMGSIEYYKMQALKNVLFAGMENTYKEQIKYLKEGIKNFHEAQEYKCEFFYTTHLLLINSLIAHSEGNIRECKQNINTILKLHETYKNEKFNPSIEILINELPNIQKKLIDYTCEPKHLKRLVNESSRKCNEIINNTFPQLQFYKPGIYRILFHIINNMKESWQNVNSSNNDFDIWYLKRMKETKKIWKKLCSFLKKINLNYFPSTTYENENILNKNIYDLLKKKFQNITLNKQISGRIHIDLSDDTIAIEIKKLESNTAKDELIGQIMEDLRIGNYKYGIVFGIDISKKKELTRYNELFFSNGNLFCIIKPYPY